MVHYKISLLTQWQQQMCPRYLAPTINKKGLMQSGAKQWSLKLPANKLQRCVFCALTSNRGPILFFSRYDWILDCWGDAMKKLFCLARAFSRMKLRGGPEESFVLQEASRRLNWRGGGVEKNVIKRAATEPRWVQTGFASSAEQAALRPSHRGDSTRDLPHLIASPTLLAVKKPMAQQLCDRDYKSSAHWLLVLTAAPPLPFLHRAQAESPAWSACQCSVMWS